MRCVFLTANCLCDFIRKTNKKKNRQKIFINFFRYLFRFSNTHDEDDDGGVCDGLLPVGEVLQKMLGYQL